jgi:hypothetical protein
MQGILSLFRSRKFWLAMVGIAQTVLFNLIPDFPPEIWEAINVLLLVLIATYAWEDAAAKRAAGTIELIDTEDEEPKG